MFSSMLTMNWGDAFLIGNLPTINSAMTLYNVITTKKFGMRHIVFPLMNELSEEIRKHGGI